MPTYLVTGGAGFIGCHIVRALVKLGECVRVFDNLSTGSLANLKDVEDKIEFVKGDLRHVGDIKQAVAGVDFISHQAAIRAVARSVDDPSETNEVNITGTLNLLIAGRQAKVKAVAYASSSAVYGDIQAEKNVETDCPNPQSPYALSKITGEWYCRQFSALYDLPTISLRYFNVYGPYQNPESKYSAVIPIFVQQLLRGQSPQIEWDGEQSRDFAYIDNVVQSNLLALAKAHQYPGEYYNVGNGENISVNQTLAMLQKLLGTRIPPQYVAKRPGDVRKTCADLSKIQKDLGYKPTTTFEQGLQKSIEWYKQTLRVWNSKLKVKNSKVKTIFYLIDIRQGIWDSWVMEENHNNKLPTELNIVVHIEKDGGFWAEFPDLPGCYTQGDNLAELSNQVQDAILTYFDVPREKAEKFWSELTLFGKGKVNLQPA